ncbi:glycerol-3-phosphate 1-O-acyltransferase PlsY [Roseinatronobacter sp.]|uniref:glycerol-3-phosphate 1-O-acyltransferase PlsY n=1 Tax=Roseinatronobacter sp. TaxID=1945755 RepID=UPI0025F8466C|nr:glycerol-3-phosphate 1-O-acyltransferase PlsY [Rhodobaca sp.]
MPELLTPLWLLGLTGLVGYMIGSIPFGVVVARVMGLGDLRAIGSGNIGATNVMRTGNKAAGILTFALDAGKGAVVALIAWATLGEDAAQVAALSAFLGHLYPVYLGFSGGKGVATFIGTALALAWPVALGVCAIWALVFKLGRISSLAALLASALSPVLALILGYPSMAALFVILTAMIFYKHIDNIRRLLSGTEPRFDRKK